MQVDQEVMKVLSRALIKGNALTIEGQLDRNLYTRTNKVLEAAGGEWSRKAKAHLFKSDAIDAIEPILLTGEVTRPQDFGFFPTPAAIVSRLLELADLGDCGMAAIEPSAGNGAIAYELAKRVEVDCVELQPAKMATINIGGGIRKVLCGDFLRLEPMTHWQDYDRAVMNPPFERQADIHHVLHAMKFLKPGGLLVSVMSAGILFRDNRLTNGFRAFLDDRGAIIEENPDGAFRESGTMVRTVNVVIPN